MGLSAVLPVIHGITLLGIDQMERRMGLSWVVLQGSLYVIGAVIYAVSLSSNTDLATYLYSRCRLECLSVYTLESLIFGAVPIRSSTF